MSLLTRRKSKSKSTENVYTTNNLPSLRRKRTIAYNRITKALEVGNLANTDESQVGLFLSYCHEIKRIAESFYESHFTILDLLKDDVDESDDELQDRFDELYFQVITIQRKFEQCSSNQADTSKRNSLTGSHSGNMRLPKISLPTFSGVIKEWPKFIATYNALIHDSTLLCDIEKFHYLVSVLSGDALSLIRTFPIASEHYLSAYEALKSRYEDKRELAFTCWRDILDVSFKTANAQDFRRALDIIDENLTILKTLKLPTDQWDFVLCYNILAKLDTKLRREFEEKYTDIELPQYKHLRAFLHSKGEALIRDTHFSAVTNKTTNVSRETSGSSHKSKQHNATYSFVAPAVTSSENVGDKQQAKYTHDSSTSIRKCAYCRNEHHISACRDFLTKSVEERMAVANEKRWCYNCLNASHSVRECTSIFSCRHCKRKHHSLLHREQVASKPSSANNSSSSSSAALVAKDWLSHSDPTVNTTVLLATALIQIRDASGEFHTFRALFDTGSQNNFLTTHAAQRLNLKPKTGDINVYGLGGSPASVSGFVTCDIGTNRTIKFRLGMLVIPSICGDQPIARLNTKGWEEVKTLPLADPGFDIPGPIDVLLGADVFAESLLEQRLKGSASQPRAFNSVFGWLLLGKSRLASSTLLGVASSTVDDSLNKIVQRFWEIDNVPHSSRLTPEEQFCENSFVNNHYRDETGRYVVCLPFKDNEEPVFEGSRALALRRFHAIERRLSRDQNLKQQYIEFMTDYIESGHMTLVPAKQMGQGKYYIPHHCVQRPDSVTTKLRVVFDAPAKDTNSKSLNDTLLTGPKLQSSIVEILLHFRKHEIVFLADVHQMYRQINLAPLHRDYQRIQWRVQPDEPLQGEVFGSFELQKWACNRPKFLSDVPAEACLSETINFTETEDTTIKVLGLKWEPSSDSFVFTVNLSNQPCTKRTILSEVARIFDPLGFLSPLTIQAKCLIQKLCILSLPWDDKPPPEFGSKWEITIAANFCSRGQFYEFLNNALWWAGSDWLSQPQFELATRIEISRSPPNDNVVPFEQRHSTFLVSDPIENINPKYIIDQLLKKSSLNKICRISAQVLRVCNSMHSNLPRVDNFFIMDTERHRASLIKHSYFQQRFWKRWKSGCLHALTPRAGWTKDPTSLTVTAIVLFKEDNRFRSTIN